MKNLVKKNLVVAFALLIAISTMSFKLAGQRNADSYWFEVGTDGQTIGGMTSAPAPVDACRHPNLDDICKVNLNTDEPPATVADAISEESFLGAVSRPETK